MRRLLQAATVVLLVFGFTTLALAAPQLPADPSQAPELDPGMMVGALTLLAGGIAMLTASRSRK